MSRALRFLLLVLVWCLLMGGFTPGQLLLGCGFALLIRQLPYRDAMPKVGRIRPLGALRLTVIVAWDLLVSSLRVAWDAMTTARGARSRILSIEVAELDAVGLTVLGNAITLTPGTLTLDIDEEAKTLHVHLMYAEEAEPEREQIAGPLAAHVRAAFPAREEAP